MSRLLSALAFSRGGFRSCLTQAGYTLYELMVSSAIVSVVGVGAVSMIGLVQDTRMTTTVNQLMGDLNLARSEAIKRGTMVSLCKSNNGVSCTDDSAWHEGWLMFADENNNHDVDPGEPVIRVQQALAGDMTLRYGNSGQSYVRYNSSGEVYPGATFTFCDGRGAGKAKAVIVYWSGRPRVSAKTSEDKPLRC